MNININLFLRIFFGCFALIQAYKSYKLADYDDGYNYINNSIEEMKNIINNYNGD